MNSIAELGPGVALDGPLAEACVSQFADASGGGDLDFVAFVVELVLDKLLNPVVIGANDLLWGQKEVKVLSVVLIQLSPSELAWLVCCLYRHGCSKTIRFDAIRFLRPEIFNLGLGRFPTRWC